MRTLGSLIVLLLSAGVLLAQTNQKPGQPNPAVDLIVSSVDLNGDGRPDLVTYTDARGTIVRDEQDFNHDGVMDDFRYYEKGKLVREEIDTDFDGRIDLWVYLAADGRSVLRYERDTDGDGKPDLVRDFGGG